MRTSAKMSHIWPSLLFGCFVSSSSRKAKNDQNTRKRDRRSLTDLYSLLQYVVVGFSLDT